jgi:hypothetical protein
MNITKEQIVYWLNNNGIQSVNDEDLVNVMEQCFNDLAPKWVSVDNELPITKADGMYLTRNVIATDGSDVCEISFHSGSVPTDWYEWSEYGDIEPNLIKHWMPLPDPQK